MHSLKLYHYSINTFDLPTTYSSLVPSALEYSYLGPEPRKNFKAISRKRFAKSST